MDPNPQPEQKIQEEVSYTPPQSWGADQTTLSPTFSETLPPIDSPVLPTTPINPSLPQGSSSFSRTLLIGVALILLGTLLGVLAARFLPMTTNTLVPLPPISLTPTVFEPILAPTVEITPIPTPTATPSALLDLKWNMMTVKSPLPRFSSYRIFYPTTWSIKEYKNTPEVVGKNQGSSTLTLQKGDLSFSILQNEGEGTVCLYPNSSDFEGRFTRFGDFRSIYKDLFTWRWAESLLVEGADQRYLVCEQPQGGLFSTSTSIGFISLPFGDLDNDTLEEFNYILEKIVIIK